MCMSHPRRVHMREYRGVIDEGRIHVVWSGEVEKTRLSGGMVRPSEAAVTSHCRW